MIISALLPLAVMLHSPITDDPLASAAEGLVAQIEDDNGGSDAMMTSIATKDCATIITAEGERSWNIDWRKADIVALEDTFVFVSAPDVKIAIVGDASKPDQAAKLEALAVAMYQAKGDCQADKEEAAPAPLPPES